MVKIIKTQTFFNILFTFYFSILFGQIRDGENKIKNESTKGGFAKANMFFFHFIDKDGKYLVDLKNHTFFPVSFMDSLSEIITPDGDLKIDINKEDEQNFLYNHNRNRILIYKDGSIAWNTCLTGNHGCDKSQMYVRLNKTDIDTLTVKYKFINSYGRVDGPKDYAEIDSLFYNNTLITFHGNKVFIKKIGNSTSISFEK